MKWLTLVALLFSLIVRQPLLAQDQNASPATIDPVLLAGVEDRGPVRSAAENYEEARAYNYLLVNARKFTDAQMRAQARTDLTFVHLFEEPGKYRGQLITLKGRLRRLIRLDPPPLAAKEGVPDLYEGWMTTAGSFPNSFCVVASEIGRGLKPGEKLDRAVTFTGYSFKRYRFPAGDGVRDAPLLIGRSIEPTAEASEPLPSLLGSVYLPAIFAILGATVILALALAWRLRASDRKVRARLQELRDARTSGTPAVTDSNPFADG